MSAGNMIVRIVFVLIVLTGIWALAANVLSR